MSEKNQITYDKLAAVADHLSHEGRKVALKYVRRKLGKGTHAQIAVLLGKWQKENAHLINKNKGEINQYSSTKPEDLKINIDNAALYKPDAEDLKLNKTTDHQKKLSQGQNKHRRSYSRTKFISNGDSDESYKAIIPRESLTSECFESEPAIIQKLFQALAIIRNTRLVTQEHYQNTQHQILNTRMECDQQARELQKYATEQVLSLQNEFSRLNTIYDQEIIAIRRQLSL